MKTILCYGDSNTYGYNPNDGGRYSKEIRWTTVLQNNLGTDYEVICEGLNGRTTAYDRQDGVFKNGLTYLNACIHSHFPLDYIVFMLGTNDCNVDLNLTSKDIGTGMEELIKVVEDNYIDMQGYKPQIIVVVPASIKGNCQNSPFADQIDEHSIMKSKEIASIYKELSYKHKCIYLDCSELEVSSIDCEHLTEESHKKLGNILADLIKYK